MSQVSTHLEKKQASFCLSQYIDFVNCLSNIILRIFFSSQKATCSYLEHIALEAVK